MKTRTDTTDGSQGTSALERTCSTVLVSKKDAKPTAEVEAEALGAAKLGTKPAQSR
jgi:hypothetical protein